MARQLVPPRPPGPRINLALAVIGQLLPGLFPFDPLIFGQDIARQFGDIAHYSVGPLHVYQLSHPDLARQILVEQPEKFHKPQLLKRAFRSFAGDGLLTSDGAHWKQQRKLMQPAFAPSHFAAYGAVMVAHALQLVDSLAEGQPLEISATMARLTLAIVIKCLFGADLTEDTEGVGRLMGPVLDAANQRLNSAIAFPSWVPTPRNLRERRAVVKLDAMLHGMIRARRASGGDHDDLLSALLRASDEESGIGMSDRQLRDEMMTLVLAGHETTAMALTWTWYLLTQHPDVEARLLGELQQVLGGRAPAVPDLPNLPYTEMIVREAMRLYPPAPGVAREPIEDVTIAGYEVPKGSLVTVNSYALHRDRRFFDDPERFNPDRFARGWEDRVSRCAYLPFGAGPRVCIGAGFAMMEARLILATVAQRYKLALRSGQTVVPMQLVTVRPKHGVWMTPTRRQNPSGNN